MGYNEYCKFCVFFDRRKGYCNYHYMYRDQYDYCNAFRRDE